MPLAASEQLLTNAAPLLPADASCFCVLCFAADDGDGLPTAELGLRAALLLLLLPAQAKALLLLLDTRRQPNQAAAAEGDTSACSCNTLSMQRKHKIYNPAHPHAM